MQNKKQIILLIFLLKLFGFNYLNSMQSSPPPPSPPLPSYSSSSSPEFLTAPIAGRLIGVQPIIGRITPVSNFLDVVKFCFLNLPEHKAGEGFGNLNYPNSHVQEFFGPEFSNLNILIGRVGNILEHYPNYYIEKKLVDPKNRIFVIGDIHSSLHSLLRDLIHLYVKNNLNNNWKLSPNRYLVFTGDYADRGYYGLEVLYIILKLKEANPDQVFLVKGNHEDLERAVIYGLLNEISQKMFGANLEQFMSLYDQKVHRLKNIQPVPEFHENAIKYLKEKICSKIFDKLPSSIFIGTNKADGNPSWVQFVHGSLVLDSMKNVDVYAKPSTPPGQRAPSKTSSPIPTLIIPENMISVPNFLNNEQSNIASISRAEDVQYTWGSFILGNEIHLTSRGAGFFVGIDLLEAYLGATNISMICRGHDHTPGGIVGFSRIDGQWVPFDRENVYPKVITFMSCPEGLGGNHLNEDAYGSIVFNGVNWVLAKANIFNRDDYSGLERKVSELDLNAFWFVSSKRNAPTQDVYDVNIDFSLLDNRYENLDFSIIDRVRKEIVEKEISKRFFEPVMEQELGLEQARLGELQGLWLKQAKEDILRRGEQKEASVIDNFRRARIEKLEELKRKLEKEKAEKIRQVEAEYREKDLSEKNRIVDLSSAEKLSKLRTEEEALVRNRDWQMRNAEQEVAREKLEKQRLMEIEKTRKNALARLIRGIDFRFEQFDKLNKTFQEELRVIPALPILPPEKEELLKKAREILDFVRIFSNDEVLAQIRIERMRYAAPLEFISRISESVIERAGRMWDLNDDFYRHKESFMKKAQEEEVRKAEQERLEKARIEEQEEADLARALEISRQEAEQAERRAREEEIRRAEQEEAERRAQMERDDEALAARLAEEEEAKRKQEEADEALARRMQEQWG